MTHPSQNEYECRRFVSPELVATVEAMLANGLSRSDVASRLSLSAYVVGVISAHKSPACSGHKHTIDRKWSEWELRKLRTMRRLRQTTAEIAFFLGRSEKSVNGKCSQLVKCGELEPIPRSERRRRKAS